MVSVKINEDKAALITVIFYLSGCLCFFWILFFVFSDVETPWSIWIFVFTISVLALCLIALFIVFLVGCKTIVSYTSIAKVAFGKKREILREDILSVTNVVLARGEVFYVVYPKGYDEALMKRQASIYLSDIERTKLIRRDKLILAIRKTKKTTEILQSFGYVPRAN